MPSTSIGAGSGDNISSSYPCAKLENIIWKNNYSTKTINKKKLNNKFDEKKKKKQNKSRKSCRFEEFDGGKLKDLYTVDDKYIDFFNKLNPVAYKYKVGHRTHLGFGAQSVEKALYNSGLNTEEFAGILVDKNVDIGEGEKLSPDGKTHFDKLYSIRYEEFIALNTLMIQKLQKRISELEGLLGR